MQARTNETEGKIKQMDGCKNAGKFRLSEPSVKKQSKAPNNNKCYHVIIVHEAHSFRRCVPVNCHRKNDNQKRNRNQNQKQQQKRQIWNTQLVWCSRLSMQSYAHIKIANCSRVWALQQSQTTLFICCRTCNLGARCLGPPYSFNAWISLLLSHVVRCFVACLCFDHTKCCSLSPSSLLLCCVVFVEAGLHIFNF